MQRLVTAKGGVEGALLRSARGVRLNLNWVLLLAISCVKQATVSLVPIRSKNKISPAQQLKQEFDKDEDDVDLTDEAKWEDVHCIRCVQPRSVGLVFPRGILGYMESLLNVADAP
jgi:hypothetical protein